MKPKELVALFLLMVLTIALVAAAKSRGTKEPDSPRRSINLRAR